MKDFIKLYQENIEEFQFDYLENKVLNQEAKKFIELVFELFFNTNPTCDGKIASAIKQKILGIQSVLYNLLTAYGTHEEPNLSENEKQELIEKYMGCLPEVREYLYYDVEAIYKNDPACQYKEEVILAYPGFYALFVYRIAHELYKLNVRILPRLLTELAHTRTGIDISPGAQIGKYFSIDHGTGIVIGETTIIHDNVNIYQGVTLGALSTRGGQLLKGTKRHPTIMNNVTIYANATILGGETVIGEGVTIKANAFITESIEKNAK